MKYVIKQGFIDQGSHISYENGYLDEKIFDNEKEAIKYAIDHMYMLFYNNEYFEIDELDDDMDFVNTTYTVYANDEELI